MRVLFLDRIAASIAPHVCIACGLEGAVLCSNCLVYAGEPPAPRCAGCKVLSDGYRTCPTCRSWLHLYAVYVASEYNGIYEQLIHEYKFRCKRQAVEPIVAIMRQAFTHLDISQVLVAALPTASSRRRQRGFDHAQLLAQTYLRAFACTQSKAPPYHELLVRRSNSRQLGANRLQRVRQMEGEFWVRSDKVVLGKTVLLIDDVITTGASLAAAAKVLKAAGAKRVYGLVFAQKM